MAFEIPADQYSNLANGSMVFSKVRFPFTSTMALIYSSHCLNRLFEICSISLAEWSHRSSGTLVLVTSVVSLALAVWFEPSVFVILACWTTGANFGSSTGF